MQTCVNKNRPNEILLSISNEAGVTKTDFGFILAARDSKKKPVVQVVLALHHLLPGESLSDLIWL